MSRPPRRQIRTAPMHHFRRHANAFAQSGMWVNGFADVHGVFAHFDGQSHFADEVANREAVRLIGVHRNVEVDETTVGLVCPSPLRLKLIFKSPIPRSTVKLTTPLLRRQSQYFSKL